MQQFLEKASHGVRGVCVSTIPEERNQNRKLRDLVHMDVCKPMPITSSDGSGKAQITPNLNCHPEGMLRGYKTLILTFC